MHNFMSKMKFECKGACYNFISCFIFFSKKQKLILTLPLKDNLLKRNALVYMQTKKMHHFLSLTFSLG